MDDRWPWNELIIHFYLLYINNDLSIQLGRSKF